MKKIIKNTLIIIIATLLTIGIYIFANGYILYKQTIKKMSISDKVEQIRQSEKFVSINEIPQNYKNAVIAVEDHRFNEHGAVDVIAIGRALTSNIKNKELVEGGSTITQQVAKNLYFMENLNDSIDRKIAEILISIKLEKNNSKNEIIFHILTMINVGFIEEIIFRGFLFKMMAKESVKRAILVSALTFGIGHIVNLLNGASIIPTLLQICYAVSLGYLFVLIFYKSKSLIPCIITHALINSLSIFNIETKISLYIIPIFLIIVPLLYAYYINKNIN